jgi:membrane fusion protein (multidrug efflux system)
LNKRTNLWIFVTLLAGLIAWKLFSNKKQLQSEAELSKVTRAYVPVEITSPRVETLGTSLETDGIFMPIKEMFVISETQGRVLEVYKNKGEWVNEGDLIAKIDEELLRTELEATQANIAKLRKDQQRLGNLIEGDAAPKNKIEDLELGIMAAEAKEKALKKQIANTSIKATMSGTLSYRFIERGSVIGPGIQVAQITNVDKLLLMVKATERDVLYIKKGLKASVKADVYPELELKGIVTNIGIRADNAFNYDVDIEVNNLKNSPLRAGMHAKAVFSFDTRREGLTIPRKAISGSLQAPNVFIAVDSFVQIRPVTLGGIFNDKVEVLSGIKVSDKVVVTGQMNLNDGSKIQVIKEQLY